MVETCHRAGTKMTSSLFLSVKILSIPLEREGRVAARLLFHLVRIKHYESSATERVTL